MSDSPLSMDQLKIAWHQAVAHHLEFSGEPVSRETPVPKERLVAELPADLWERLEFYVSRVLEANRGINLVSRRNPERQILENTLDGILLGILLGFVSRETPNPWLLIDAGSGSGIPGIPARLCLGDPPVGPNLVLVDSQRKKQDFLEDLVVKMGLNSTSVFRGRLESPEFAGHCSSQFPGATLTLCSKAFAETNQTLQWASRLQPNLGNAFLVKGPAWIDELPEESPKVPGWRLLQAHRFTYPHRASVVLELKSFPK